MIHVICSRWGNKYSIEYVNKLYSMVKRHLPADFRFYCQTDDTNGMDSAITQLPFLEDIPESTPQAMLDSEDWMNDKPRLWDRPKLNYFNPYCWGLEGIKLAFDLDVIVHNNLIPILDLYDKPLTGRSWWHDMDKEKLPFWRRNYGARNNGSFYMWEGDDFAPIWKDLQKNWKKIYFIFHGGSDNFITTRHLDLFDFVPSEYYYSMNRSGTKIQDEKIICTFNTDANEFSPFEIHDWVQLDPKVAKLWG